MLKTKLIQPGKWKRHQNKTNVTFDLLSNKQTINVKNNLSSRVISHVLSIKIVLGHMLSFSLILRPVNLIYNISKMSVNISTLSSQAAQADKLISQLHQEINSIRQNVLSNLYKREQARLEGENEGLRREVEEWKHKLVQLEIAHGVNQVAMPSSKRVKEDTSPSKSPAKTSPTPQKGPTPTLTPNKSVKPQNTDEKIKPEKQTEKPKPEKKEKGPKEASKPAKTNKPAEEDEKIDVGRLDLRIGRIQAIDKHPDADALYVEQIDLAEEKPRTIVSGLVKHVKAEDLKDRLVMVLCNLKPAKMRGVTSEGMVMCASSPDKVEVLIPPPGSVPGDKVICPGYDLRPDTPFMNPKKKIFEGVAPDLKANEQGIATYKGVALEVIGKGQVKAPTMTNCQIK